MSGFFRYTGKNGGRYSVSIFSVIVRGKGEKAEKIKEVRGKLQIFKQFP